MQITYEEYQRQTGHGGNCSRTRISRKKPPMARREIRRLSQLGISIVLFLVVFLGRGQFPTQLEALGEQLRYSADFSAAFADLGRAVSEGDSVSAAVGNWCVSVFSPTELEAVSYGLPEDWTEREIRTVERVSPEHWIAALDPAGAAPVRASIPIECRAIPETEGEGETAGTAVSAEAAQPEGPETKLGLEETVTPAMGVISSGFGYREHPLSGKETFHNGVDLAVEKGTEIKAFADGVVDFIGKSEAYGNYIQLRHANGVTTFYAHCSELLLPKGTEVHAGEVIALSGDTGDVTGPHLHLELEVNDVRVDPVEYIETLAP